MKKLIASILFVLTLSLVNTDTAWALETPYLNSSSLGGGQVKLWWSPVSGAQSYQIFYGPKDNLYAHGVVVGESTSYTVGALFENTKYGFTVKAVKDGEVSGYSNWVWSGTGPTGRSRTTTSYTPTAQATVGSQKDGKVVTPAVSYNQSMDTMRSDAAPNSPYISSGKVGYGQHNLRTSSGLERGAVTLHWNDPMMSNTGSFNIVYTDDPNVEKWGVLNLPGNARNYTVRGLESGKRYWFWMSSERLGQTPWVSDVAR